MKRGRVQDDIAFGLPVPREDFKNQVSRGSLGGPPIWSAKPAYMPKKSKRCTCDETKRSECPHHIRQDTIRHAGRHNTTHGHSVMKLNGDPDGYAVFGRYPKGWLRHVIRLRLLGSVQRDEILHVCSGTLAERWTVDIRPQARPAVLAKGQALPFADASFRAIMVDPPYSDQYARNLYGTENPRPSHLLREAARVVQPGGRIGMLHVAVPFKPPGCFTVNVWGVSTGMGYRIRAFTVFERSAQEDLPL